MHSVRRPSLLGSVISSHFVYPMNFLLLGWSLAFPMDLVKSRIQSSSTTTPAPVASVFRLIYQKQGLRGFYRGWSSAVIRAFPANAGLFLGYEMAIKFMAGKK